MIQTQEFYLMDSQECNTGQVEMQKYYLGEAAKLKLLKNTQLIQLLYLWKNQEAS